MKEIELFSIRDKTLKINNPLALKNKLFDFFDKNYDFPLVHGYCFENKKNNSWELQYLKPRELSDELTVKNFIFGLDKISYLGKKDLVDFKGEVIYEGVGYRNRGSLGKRILSAGFTCNDERYFLNLHLTLNNEKDNLSFIPNLSYLAYSQIEDSRIRNMMKDLIGPNKEKKI